MGETELSSIQNSHRLTVSLDLTCLLGMPNRICPRFAQRSFSKMPESTSDYGEKYAKPNSNLVKAVFNN